MIVSINYIYSNLDNIVADRTVWTTAQWQWLPSLYVNSCTINVIFSIGGHITLGVVIRKLQSDYRFCFISFMRIYLS